MNYTPISEIVDTQDAMQDAMQDAAENAQRARPGSASATILAVAQSLLGVGIEIAARLDHMIELMEGMRPPAKT